MPQPSEDFDGLREAQRQLVGEPIGVYLACEAAEQFDFEGGRHSEPQDNGPEAVDLVRRIIGWWLSLMVHDFNQVEAKQ